MLPTPLTYIDKDAGQCEDAGVRVFLGDVPEELLPTLVPLDGVERVTLQVIAAQQGGRRTVEDCRRYLKVHLPQPTGSLQQQSKELS